MSQPEGTGEETTLSPHVDYLAFPVLSRIRFGDGSVVPYLVGGPSANILLSTNPDGFGLILNDFRRFELGMSVGAGLQFPLDASSTVMVELRYGSSITPAYDNEHLKVTNESFELLLGIPL